MPALEHGGIIGRLIAGEFEIYAVQASNCCTARDSPCRADAVAVMKDLPPNVGLALTRP
jgi:hypothetical protein